MKLTSRNLLIGLRYIIALTAIFISTFWIKVALLILLIGIVYLEYRVSTIEQRDRLIKGLFGRTSLIIIGVMLFFILLMYLVFRFSI